MFDGGSFPHVFEDYNFKNVYSYVYGIRSIPKRSDFDAFLKSSNRLYTVRFLGDPVKYRYDKRQSVVRLVQSKQRDFIVYFSVLVQRDPEIFHCLFYERYDYARPNQLSLSYV